MSEESSSRPLKDSIASSAPLAFAYSEKMKELDITSFFSMILDISSTEQGEEISIVADRWGLKKANISFATDIIRHAKNMLRKNIGIRIEYVRFIILFDLFINTAPSVRCGSE